MIQNAFLPRLKGLSLILLLLAVAACAAQPTPTATPPPLPTSLTPEMPALVKNSIEFTRNGKTYEVVIGYHLGNAFYNATPRPALPEKYDDVGWGFASLEGYGDFDQDGETEFYVTVSYCGANCSEELRLYQYDPSQDQFIVADRVSTNEFRLEQYEDLNQDGNPELIVNGPGYCLYGDAGNKVFAVVTVLRYENGKITDVTSEFPSVIAEDAEHFLSFSKTDGDHQGVGSLTLASYLYDMYRLGKLEEARPNFIQVCNEVVKPRSQEEGFDVDCQEFLAEVEADIQKYEQSNSQK